MAKLWEKDYQISDVVESFTVGEDYLLDKELIFYDCLGSIAHATMLEKIGILTKEELSNLKKALKTIIDSDNFSIKKEDEDVHTAIENFITENFGDVGKKLHTARSRNDQVALDTRLFSKVQILKLTNAILNLAKALKDFAEKNKAVPIPGRTHFQRAMPSSVGLWAGAFAESLLDDIKILQNAYDINNQCPLGSAASYGVPLPIDRQLTSDLLGFAKVQNNVLYANNSRGKIESVIVHAMVQVMNDLSKLATDIICFAAPEFGYFVLPKNICPGSSIMPQKHNPCVMELVRAKAATASGYLFQLLEIIRGLPSGYNRDLQETKAPLIKSFGIAIPSTEIVKHVINGMEVDQQRCIESFSSELFATDYALELVSKGTPFRDAYRQVKTKIESVEMPDPKENILSKKHIGATGNLGLELSEKEIKSFKNWLEKEEKNWDKTVKKLIEEK